MSGKKTQKMKRDEEDMAGDQNAAKENRPLDDAEAEKIVVSGTPAEWQHAHPSFDHWDS